MMCLLEEQNGKKFDKSQWKSLGQVAKMVDGNGGTVFKDIESLRIGLNSFK